MKSKTHFLGLAVMLFAFSLLIACEDHAPIENNCEGYTGQVKDARALKLTTAAHFIRKDTIDEWTQRYEKNKRYLNINQDSLSRINPIMGDSCSFNRCAVKAIICNPNCIGLRVLYGLNSKNEVKIILVGVAPDYSTLYIDNPDAICGKGVMGQGPDGPGGLDYGQHP
jgi:hypothetical protein